MEEINIRCMKYKDIEKAMEINKRFLPTRYPYIVWLYLYLMHRGHNFVAIHANTIIGYILADCNEILSLVVHKNYRRKGIGKMLLFHALNTYDKTLCLHVRTSNKIAIKLYKSCGFKLQNIKKSFYANNSEDAYVMKRFIKTKYDVQSEINI